MQRMDMKYDNNFWCKVKMTNIKNDFNIKMLIEIKLKMEYQSSNSNSSRILETTKNKQEMKHSRFMK
jgi:hypothetical protein